MTMIFHSIFNNVITYVIIRYDHFDQQDPASSDFGTVAKEPFFSRTESSHLFKSMSANFQVSFKVRLGGSC